MGAGRSRHEGDRLLSVEAASEGAFVLERDVVEAVVIRFGVLRRIHSVWQHGVFSLSSRMSVNQADEDDGWKSQTRVEKFTTGV